MKMYEKLEIEVYILQVEDVIRTSFGAVDGDETKYPIPEDWLD